MKITLVSLALFAVLACVTSPALAGLPGGLADIDTEDEVVVEMANFAVGELGNDYTLVKIRKAQTQMVAGIIYHLKLDVERTTGTGRKRSYTCKAKVFEEPWTDTIEMMGYKCNNKD